MGATVKIVMLVKYDTTKYPNLDSYRRALVTQCPSWQKVQDNLIVVMFSAVTHEENLSVGGQLGDLGLAWQPVEDINEGEIIPRMSNNDFDGAIWAGLARIQALLTEGISCDSMVYDGPGALSKLGAVNIQKAASNLTDMGAVVRVIIVSSFDTSKYRDLNAALDYLPRQCTAWGGESGNVIAVLIGYYQGVVQVDVGGKWVNPNVTSQAINDIQVQDMTPRFNVHDFDGGIIAGIEKLTTLINSQ
jgi:uncharacterized membrane protein YgcG